MFTLSIEDVLVDLMDLSHSLVEVEKLHQLATEAGFELNFLSHFGAKILPCNKIEELEFWIGLAQRKLSVAFCKEMVVRGTENSHEKVNSIVQLNLLIKLLHEFSSSSNSFIQKYYLEDTVISSR